MVGEIVFTIALAHLSESLANARHREGHTPQPQMTTYAEVQMDSTVGPYEVMGELGGCRISGVVTIIFSAFVEMTPAEVEKARKEVLHYAKAPVSQKHSRN